ncbi:MAG: TIGR02147 family protein [Fibrobacter sp.]|nr:TIGR02147 family protein [Fibrobacter sp.]
MSDYYKWHKKNTYGFSYRLMAGTLGFTSPNFLKLVIDGERNLGKESLEKITQGIGLNKLEAEYFSYLVFFDQARDTVGKNYYYGLLASLRSKSIITKVAPEQFEYLHQWYHPTVRELVAGKNEPLDYQQLSKSLYAKVSVSQIKRSISLLLRLNLIRLNDNNVYELVDPLLNTGNEFKNFAVRNYHKQILSIAQSLIPVVQPQYRENSHDTLKLSQKGFQKIKKRIQEFRQELLQLASEDRNVDGVYHVNIQLYPITKNGENEKTIE